MRVALVQNSPRFGKKEENIQRLFSLIDQERADVYVLPELAYTGYQFISKKEVEELADPLDSKAIQMFKEKASQRGSLIIFGFPERAEEGFFNSSLAVLPDGTTVLYRKTHLFYKEKTLLPTGEYRFFRIHLQVDENRSRHMLRLVLSGEFPYPGAARGRSDSP